MENNKNGPEQHGLFKITQNIFLFNEKNELLLLQHNSGKWLLVGGQLNASERWDNGLRREVAEETGIKEFSIDGILQVDNWEHKGLHQYGVFFYGKTKKENKITLSDEHINYRWVKDREEIEELDFWGPELRERIINGLENVRNLLEKQVSFLKD